MAAYTQVTSLSSAGTSPQLSLDPTAKTTTISLSVSGASASDVVIQANLWQPGSAGAPSFVSVSSHITSSTGSFADGVYLAVLSPIAGLRLSSSTWTSGTATLQALQSITA